MRLRKSIFRYVEAELYDYPYTLRQVAELRDELEGDVPVAGHNPLGVRVNPGHHSDPTRRRAEELVTNRRLQRMVETVNAIEKVIERLPEDKQRLFELKWLERKGPLSPEGIASLLHVSRQTYYNWREEIVAAVAVELGLVDATEIGKSR